MMTAKAAALTSFVALALLGAPSHGQLRQAPGPSSEAVSLTPRKLIPKLPNELLSTPDSATGRLIVKFRDECRARCTPEGDVVALATDIGFRSKLGHARQIIMEAGFTLAPALGKTDDQLLALQERAQLRSGRAQPDLAGILQLDGPSANLESLAKALNSSDATEWVVYETYPVVTSVPAPVFEPNVDPAENVAQPMAAIDSIEMDRTPVTNPIGPALGACCRDSLPCLENVSSADCAANGGTWLAGAACTDCTSGCCVDINCFDLTAAECATVGGDFQTAACAMNPCPTAGACCVDDTCSVATAAFCAAQSGMYQGDGVSCDPDPCGEPMCGVMGTGDCFDPAGTGSAYCTNLVCCDFVCSFDEICCDETDGTPGWDQYCAAIANLNCGFAGGNACDAAWIAGNCTTPHGDTGGCADPACCALVVGANGGCASSWTEGCARLAAQMCGTGMVLGPETTPDFTGLQFYGTGMGWGGSEPSFVQMITFGMGPPVSAQGWDGGGIPFPDVDTIGDQLISLGVDGLGLGNLSRGKSIKVAVIDIGYHVNHEAVQTVKLEQGISPSDLNPIVANLERGTAALAMLAAQPNGEGITGLVHDARVTFYPIATLSAGPRNLSAWTNAVDSLDAGDVIAAPYTVETEPTYNMNNRPDTWTLIRLASDSGISVAVAAGDACADLAIAPDLGDSGGSVVTATTPCANGFRMPPSNWTTDPDNATSHTVHFHAWGSGVVTAGYGDLHKPMSNDVNKYYTERFGGTAAATMMTAASMVATQGIAKQFFGIPLTPATIRAILGGEVSIPIVTREALNGGFSLDPGCTVDNDPGLLFYIGSFPGPVGASTTLQLDPDVGFDQSPLLQDIVVVRGLQVDGNRFSVKASDDSYLSLSPMRTQRNSGGTNVNGIGSGNFQGTSVPEIASVSYLATGLITDIVAVGQVDDDLDIVNTLILESEVDWPNVFTILIVEMYDFRAQRWQFVDIVTNTPAGNGADATNVHTAFGSPRFMRLSDRRILARFYTVGFPSISPQGGDTSYRMKYDYINIFASDVPGEQLP